MENWKEYLFGHGTQLNTLQLCDRAVIVFFITLILLRVAGVRTFGSKSAFDNVIIIVLGSVLSRAVIGASPFVPIVAGSLAFVLVHRVLGWLSCYSDWVGMLVKGEKLTLFEHGSQMPRNMHQAQVSEKDLLESVRANLNKEELTGIKAIYMERDGTMSVVEK